MIALRKLLLAYVMLALLFAVAMAQDDSREIFAQAYTALPFPTSSLTRVPLLNGRR